MSSYTCYTCYSNLAPFTSSATQTYVFPPPEEELNASERRELQEHRMKAQNLLESLRVPSSEQLSREYEELRVSQSGSREDDIHAYAQDVSQSPQDYCDPWIGLTQRQQAAFPTEDLQMDISASIADDLNPEGLYSERVFSGINDTLQDCDNDHPRFQYDWEAPLYPAILAAEHSPSFENFPVGFSQVHDEVDNLLQSLDYGEQPCSSQSSDVVPQESMDRPGEFILCRFRDFNSSMECGAQLYSGPECLPHLTDVHGISTSHNGKDVFDCTWPGCMESIKQSSRLRHALKHLCCEECPECFKQFSRPDVLKVHANKQHQGMVIQSCTTRLRFD